MIMNKGKEIYKRSKLIHQIEVIPKRHIFNLSFYIPLVIVFIFLCSIMNVFNHTKAIINEHKLVEITNFLRNNSMNIFSIAITAISMIMAAIAIIIVLYERNDLHKIIIHDDVTFEGFIFPYKWGSILWATVALSSFSVNLFNVKLNSSFLLFLVCLFTFLLLYSSLYMIYLINEVIQHVMMASYIDK